MLDFITIILKKVCKTILIIRNIESRLSVFNLEVGYTQGLIFF